MQSSLILLMIGPALLLANQAVSPSARARAVPEAMAESRLAVRPGASVAARNPPCGDPRFDVGKIPPDVKQAASAAFARHNQTGTPLGLTDAFLSQPAGTGLGTLVRKFSAQRNAATCVRLLVIVPKTVRVTRIVKDMNCPAGGWCGFAGEPVTEDIDIRLFGVSVVAKNWSANQTATARLQVFYRR